jgi:hypothetical protein
MWVVVYSGPVCGCDWRVSNIMDIRTKIKLSDVQWVFDDYDEAHESVNLCKKCIGKHPGLLIEHYGHLDYETWHILAEHKKHFKWCLKNIDTTYQLISEPSIFDVYDLPPTIPKFWHTYKEEKIKERKAVEAMYFFGN